MNLQGFFDLNKNKERKRWEFTPNDKVESTSYTVAFYEAENEEDAWITLYMAVQKSPRFYIKEKALTKSARLGKQFKKVQVVSLYVIPLYFVGRILVSIIFNV